MLKPLSFVRAHKLLAAALAVVLIAGTGAVVAQTAPMQPIQWDSRRLEQLDRSVRRLERAITQRNAAGQPFLVEPDPEVVTLQSRVDIMDRRLRDLEATFQRVNADIERLTFALDESERDRTALGERLGDADDRIKALETAAAAAATARREAEERATASPTGSAAGDLAAARVLVTTDRAAGVTALERIIANWPEADEASEAEWRLGDVLRAGDDHPAAVSAYARALRGWPTFAWAGEVTLKLARSLIATERQQEACAALGEFDRRYAEDASADLRRVAARVRDEADCA